MATATPVRPSADVIDLRPVPRVGALDRLRAVALLLLLVHHLTEWLVGDARSILPGWEGLVLTDVAAPAFAIAAGASSVLFTEAQRRKGQPSGAIAVDVVRRYGLLVLYGIGIHWALWGNALGWGVLETLGLCVLLSTLVTRMLPTAGVATAAAVALVAGPALAIGLEGRDDLVGAVFGPGFPLVTYLGFALAGAVAGRLLLRDPDLGAEALVAGGALTLVVAALTAAGLEPDRHPGSFSQFVLPGLAGTLLLYGWLGAIRIRPRSLDALVRRAGRHTLGVFICHYAIYGLLRATGRLGDASPGVGITLAVVVAVALVTVAPRVPTLPWSPRTGRAKAKPEPVAQAPKTLASSSGTGRSNWS